MPRYLVKRTFADHLEMPTNAEGVNACRVVIANNREDLLHLELRHRIWLLYARWPEYRAT